MNYPTLANKRMDWKRLIQDLTKAGIKKTFTRGFFNQEITYTAVIGGITFRNFTFGSFVSPNSDGDLYFQEVKSILRKLWIRHCQT